MVFLPVIPVFHIEDSRDVQQQIPTVSNGPAPFVKQLRQLLLWGPDASAFSRGFTDLQSHNVDCIEINTGGVCSVLDMIMDIHTIPSASNICSKLRSAAARCETAFFVSGGICPTPSADDEGTPVHSLPHIEQHHPQRGRIKP